MFGNGLELIRGLKIVEKNDSADLWRLSAIVLTMTKIVLAAAIITYFCFTKNMSSYGKKIEWSLPLELLNLQLIPRLVPCYGNIWACCGTLKLFYFLNSFYTSLFKFTWYLDMCVHNLWLENNVLINKLYTYIDIGNVNDFSMLVTMMNIWYFLLYDFS